MAEHTLPPAAAISIAGSHRAQGSACTGLQAALLAASYPSLPFNATALAVQLDPLVDGAKLVADGVLDGNPLTDFTLDDEFMATVLNYDLSAFCTGATTVLADAHHGGDWTLPLTCSDLLPSISIFLSNNPLVASKAQSAYYSTLEPVCSEFEASLDALQTFCGVGAPTLESAPPNVKQLVVGTFSGWFKALDDSFAFIFDSPGTQALARTVDSFDKGQIYTVAEALDHVDYAAFYTSSCNIASTLSTLALAILVSGAPPMTCGRG